MPIEWQMRELPNVCQLNKGHNFVVFVTEGSVVVSLGTETAWVGAEHAVGAQGGTGEVAITAIESIAKVRIVAGTAIEVPWGRHANAFIMNSKAEIAEAIAHYERVEMGNLSPRETLA